jgi:hypothetical protein
MDVSVNSVDTGARSAATRDRSSSASSDDSEDAYGEIDVDHGPRYKAQQTTITLRAKTGAEAHVNNLLDEHEAARREVGEEHAGGGYDIL